MSSNPQVSLTDIAADAGVGRATLYRHFPTREHLLDTLVEAWRDDLARALDGVDTTGTGAEVVTAMTDAAIHVMYDHRGVWSNPEVQERRHAVAPGRSLIDRWRDAIARGVADGSVRGDVPQDWLVRSVFATISAAVDAAAEGAFTLDDAARFGATVVVTGLTDTEQELRRLAEARAKG